MCLYEDESSTSGMIMWLYVFSPQCKLPSRSRCYKAHSLVLLSEAVVVCFLKGHYCVVFVPLCKMSRSGHLLPSNVILTDNSKWTVLAFVSFEGAGFKCICDWDTMNCWCNYVNMIQTTRPLLGNRFKKKVGLKSLIWCCFQCLFFTASFPPRTTVWFGSDSVPVTSLFYSSSWGLV